MAGTIPTVLNAMPDTSAHNVARPLFGRTVSTFSNGLNHLAGFRGLRFMQAQCIINAASTADDDPPHGPMNNDPIMRWVVSPLAQYVWWGAWVAAEQKSTGPSITVRLETVAGVLIDGPIEWTPDNGKLPTRVYWDMPAPAGNQGHDRIMHTGWGTQGNATDPRLLDVSGYQGQAVQIRVSTNDARVYSHMALEAYQNTHTPISRLVISEVDYDIPGADIFEFIEIYNAGRAPHDLTNTVLNYWDFLLVNTNSWPLNVGDGILQPGQRMVVGNQLIIDGLPQGTKSVLMAGSSLNNNVAGVTIDDAGNRLSGVAWEQGHGFFMPGVAEGTMLPPDAGDPRSWQRYPTDGHDTKDNAADFHLAVPTPGLPNL